MRTALSSFIGGLTSLLLLCWACVGEDPTASPTNPSAEAGTSPWGNDGSTTPTPSDDAGADVAEPTGPCDRNKPFLAPELVPSLNDPVLQTISVRFSPDGLLAFLARGETGMPTDLYRATRPSTLDPFGMATKVEFVNSTGVTEGKPSVTGDLNTLYYYRGRGGALSDIFRATRTASGYETLTLLDAPVNDPAGSQDPFVSVDGTQLFFVTMRAPATVPQIWMATEPDPDGFVKAANIAVISLPNAVFVDSPVLSGDMLSLYFGAGTGTDTAIWMTRRATPTEPFEAPELIKGAAELDLAGQRDEPSFITSDECSLYMYSNRSGVFQTYRARRAR